jgi:hypothetical protein
MRKCVEAILFILLTSFSAQAQTSIDAVDAENIKRIITILASDSLKGRGNHTIELHKAADFIANQFDTVGLNYFPGFTSYFQPFTIREVDSILLKDSTGKYNPDYVLLNVIGVLEGKSRAGEVIIFSSHYDHMGEDRTKGGDNIYNGANDNASGTTALLELARYYSLRNDNERTIVFCAFAGEELGLLGSDLFSTFVEPDAVKAVINIEMIGRKNFGGKNSFMVTGSQYSSLESILRKNLRNTKMRVLSERNEEKMLFKRSDNYPFAKKGVPAHTIMSSDDDEECYHKVCDEVKRIDLNNMTEIIRAIIIGCRTIIKGSDTPSRITENFY